MSTTKWVLDPAHSSVNFSVRHMMIAKVHGKFTDFQAEIEAIPTDLTTAKISFTIHAASITTGQDDRDNHLRSGDFFDVEKYPTITFQPSSIKKTDDDEYVLEGNVTMHGVTRKESFEVEFEGQGKDPWGNEKVGFSVEGKINRSDYGLTWNAPLETGGVLVGDEIKISLELQAAKQA